MLPSERFSHLVLGSSIPELGWKWHGTLRPAANLSTQTHRHTSSRAVGTASPSQAFCVSVVLWDVATTCVLKRRGAHGVRLFRPGLSALEKFTTDKSIRVDDRPGPTHDRKSYRGRLLIQSRCDRSVRESEREKKRKRERERERRARDCDVVREICFSCVVRCVRWLLSQKGDKL